VPLVAFIRHHFMSGSIEFSVIATLVTFDKSSN